MVYLPKQHYNRLAIDETQSKQSEYKSWVSSRPVEEIAMANSARAKLRRRLVTKRSAWKKIEDERAGKPRVSSYAAFVVERHASGDLKDIAFSERSKLLSQEWKALDASEKKVSFFGDLPGTIMFFFLFVLFLLLWRRKNIVLTPL